MVRGEDCDERWEGLCRERKECTYMCLGVRVTVVLASMQLDRLDTDVIEVMADFNGKSAEETIAEIQKVSFNPGCCEPCRV